MQIIISLRARFAMQCLFEIHIRADQANTSFDQATCSHVTNTR